MRPVRALRPACEVFTAGARLSDAAPSDAPCPALGEPPAGWSVPCRLPAESRPMDTRHSIGGLFQRWTALPLNPMAKGTPGEERLFRTTIRALPAFGAPPRMRTELAAVPPFAWKPSIAAASMGFVPAAAPAFSFGTALQEIGIEFRLGTGLGIVQAAHAGPAGRDLPRIASAPLPGFSVPVRAASLPTFRAGIQTGELDPFLRTSADEFPRLFACPAEPRLEGPEALPIPVLPNRRDKVVVMRSSSPAGVAYQPPLEAFRRVHPGPLAVRAFPALTLTPCEFPEEASA